MTDDEILAAAKEIKRLRRNPENKKAGQPKKMRTCAACTVEFSTAVWMKHIRTCKPSVEPGYGLPVPDGYAAQQ